ncbi:hypothetical protein [Streptomyces sp. NPDC017529]|uniref:hypothetical protein n=1 Tax=Streptomyces sp. NPDC017529 TaxID=3365000 RepID=UPI0037AD1A8C
MSSNAGQACIVGRGLCPGQPSFGGTAHGRDNLAGDAAAVADTRDTGGAAGLDRRGPAGHRGRARTATAGRAGELRRAGELPAHRTARHFLAALDGSRKAAPYVILACHGDEGRILLDGLAPELSAYQPFNDSAGPEEVRAHTRLTDSVVIANGCDTGDPALAEAFLDAGASAYIAPHGAPFGYASVFAPLFLFYELTEQRTLDEAVARLRAHDDELGMWELHRRT